MNENEKKPKLEWYDSGHILTNLIIGIILVIIVCSQSFAVGEKLSLTLFTSVINHNSIYLLVLVYFIFLKFPFGKRYFNYLNALLIFVYFIVMFTSLLTVVQSFSLNTMLNFVLNFVLFIYLSHTFFRDTRIWKEFHLSSSPFNELTNEWYLYAIIVISIFLLIVNLISTVVLSGVVLSILDTIYYALFGRYIYLYQSYLDDKKLDSNNEGNFDSVREKVQEVLDKTDIDEKILGIKKEDDLSSQDENHLDNNDNLESKDLKVEAKAPLKKSSKKKKLKKEEE